MTVNEYYDGPRLGVAELHGTLHVYEAEFDHSSDEYGDTYFLSPIEPDLLALVLEDWAIWRRWSAAQKRGEVTIESHPSLARERKRHDELAVTIGDRLKSDPNNRQRFKATFFYEPLEGDWDGTLVEWKAL